MRALITGGSGFVGRWLTRALLDRGDDVDITGLGETFNAPEFLSADDARRVRWMPADVREDEELDLVVERSRPDMVFHLAGVSFQPDADRSPAAAYDVNTLGAIRLFGAIQRRQLNPVLIVVGSGMQYGQHAFDEMPLSETSVTRPTTVYAASKAAQEIASFQFGLSSGLRVVCTRSFNHSGVGHGPQFLIPSLVARARAIRRGETRTLSVGNDVVRDFLHIDDVVRAYLLLADRGVAGEVYNVCSGTGVSTRQLAERVLLQLGVAADISTEASLVRATDIPVLVGSPAKLKRDTGWSPQKTYDDIIDDLVYATTD